MALFTFDSLTTTIQSYVERAGATNDPTAFAFIPTAINLTEQDIARKLKIQGFIRVVDWVMQANLAAYQKPDRWRANISMQVGTAVPSGPGNIWSPIYTRDQEFIRAYWPNSTLTGLPKYYADMDYYHWWFGPTPDAAYPVQTIYWELPPMLSATLQENWTSIYAPNALLHGSLLEMYRFLKNSTEMQWAADAYNQDMGALAGEDLQKQIDRMEKRATT